MRLILPLVGPTCRSFRALEGFLHYHWKSPVKLFCTGAPPVHHRCGEILQYRTLHMSLWLILVSVLKIGSHNQRCQRGYKISRERVKNGFFDGERRIEERVRIEFTWWWNVKWRKGEKEAYWRMTGSLMKGWLICLLDVGRSTDKDVKVGFDCW